MACTQAGSQVKRFRHSLERLRITFSELQLAGRNTLSDLLARLLNVGRIQLQPQGADLIALNQANKQLGLSGAYVENGCLIIEAEELDYLLHFRDTNRVIVAQALMRNGSVRQSI